MAARVDAIQDQVYKSMMELTRKRMQAPSQLATITSQVLKRKHAQEAENELELTMKEQQQNQQNVDMEVEPRDGSRAGMLQFVGWSVGGLAGWLGLIKYS